MATILIIRIAQEIVKYEEAAFDYLNQEDDDDYDSPMPISFGL